MSSFEHDLLGLVPQLRRFARSLTRDAGDADDLCQNALERALKARDQWQAGTRLDAWMYRIIRNCWIDEVRSRARHSVHLAPEEAGYSVSNDDHLAIERNVEISEVDRALHQLPDEQREVITLVLVEGMAYKEAAEILDIPMGTLTSRLVRGRQALIALLDETP
ncbi:MAG: sigma-70 family RNA polymerase sigma factor [Sphingobium sp.]